MSKSPKNVFKKLQLIQAAVLVLILGLGISSFHFFFKGQSAEVEQVVATTFEQAASRIELSFEARQEAAATRKEEAEAQFNGQLKQVIAILQETMPTPVWNLDDAGAKRLLAAMIDNPDILAIRVVDETNAGFVGIIQNEDGSTRWGTSTADFPTDARTETAALKQSGNEIGKVEVYVSNVRLNRTLVAIDAELESFKTESDALVSSLNSSIGGTLEAQATSILTFRVVETALVLVVSLAVLIVYLRGAIIRPIKRMIETLSAGSRDIGDASAQMAAGSETLASGVSEQAASVEETSASLEEISSQARVNTDSVTRADVLMRETAAQVDAAASEMKSLLESIEAIAHSSAETSKIIKTIDEISFQTNILALNAAVEAARAGEHGAGFAVVADEVRSLAGRAASSARSSSALLEETRERIEAGRSSVSQTNDTFLKLAAAAREVGDLLTGVSEASKEQQIGIEQINNALNEMDKVVQRTSQNAEQSAAHSEQLRARSVDLEKVVGALGGLIGGTSGISAATGAESANTAAPVEAARPASQQEAPTAKNSSPEASHQSRLPAAVAAEDDWADFDFDDSPSR